MARVILAMSGGVDSSVAAHLLLEQGHEVIGVFLWHGEGPPPDRSTSWGGRLAGPPFRPFPAWSSGSPSELQLPRVPVPASEGEATVALSHASDPRPLETALPGRQADGAQDARRVADRLNIPFHVLDLRSDFRSIIEYFVGEYLSGRTPNPCVLCNRRIKLGRLFDYAADAGAAYVATGHHARLIAVAGSEFPALCRGMDPAKDQSYVLSGVKRANLSRMLLPVGEHRKSEIRALAKTLGLPVAEKRDSQEICFVPPGQHAEFVRARRGERETSGEIVTTDGRVVGRHAGIERFTVGQRKGLGVALGQRYFVVRIEPLTRRVVIGTREELARREVEADRTNWLVDPPRGPFRCLAKIRYNSPAAPAAASVLEGDRLHVTFDEPRFGVAPGQTVVCYDGERVLAGGWIVS